MQIQQLMIHQRIEYLYINGKTDSILSARMCFQFLTAKIQHHAKET